LSDDFEAFLMWRQEKLWIEIQRVTGLKAASEMQVATGVNE
jgi:hypothetical protein